MSSHANDILEELTPLLTKKVEHEKLQKVISLFSSYTPKVYPDANFRDRLRKDILISKKQETKKRYTFSWYTFFPVFGTAFACMLFGISFWKFFFPTENMEIGIPMISRESPVSQDKGEAPAGTTSTIVNEKIEEFRAEKRSIDTEIQGIVDDMNSLDISDVSKEISPESVIPPVAPTPTVSTTTYDHALAGTASPMMMKSMPAIVSYPLPEYASTMRLYAKPGAWSADEIASRSGSGIVVRDTPTEKRSVIETKSMKILEGKTIVSSKVEYRVMSKIAVNPEKLFYLVPVVEYTTDTGEHIFISLIRGFR